MKKTIILCVDDEKVVLDSLKTELKEALGDKFMIETAEDGEDALEVIDELMKDHYDIPLIISDYIMPGMKGDELLKQVHSLSPKTLKIMLTGQADTQAVGNAVNHARLYRYIPKPWQQNDLIMTVTEAIRSFFQDKMLEVQNDQLKQLNTAYKRFVPHEFLRALGKESITDVKLGDQIKQEMTILFSDIRDYTTIAEDMTPTENFNFINTYLGRIGPAIEDNRGFVNQYIGDAIMALFTSEADDAVVASVEMHRRVAEYNMYRLSKGRQAIQIGVGLHTGPLMLGIIGDEHRMATDVIADAVNTAARMEGLTKIFGASIVISEETLSRLKDATRFNNRFLGKVRVKGKRDAVSIYEIFDSQIENDADLKSLTKEEFEKGLNLYYDKKFTESAVCFKHVLNASPKDKAANRYLHKAAHFMIESVPRDWDGVEQLESK